MKFIYLLTDSLTHLRICQLFLFSHSLHYHSQLDGVLQISTLMINLTLSCGKITAESQENFILKVAKSASVLPIYFFND